MFGLKSLGRSHSPAPAASPGLAEAKHAGLSRPGLSQDGPSALRQRDNKSSFAGCMPFAPRVNIFGKKPPKPAPEKDFRSQLEDNLKMRMEMGKTGVGKAHAAAVAKAEQAAEAGATSAELMDAIDHSLAKHKRKTTPEERTHLKYATYAQVASTHYTMASRFHGDEHSELSSHNLPKIVQNGEVPPGEMSPEQLDAALAEAAAPLQDDPQRKAFKAFMHINGTDLPHSAFVSVAEDPVAFARMDNPAAQAIAGNAPALSSYMIPNQHLTRPQDIEREFLGMPKLTDALADELGIDSIFHQHPRWGEKLYSEESPTVAAGEAVFLAGTHLDHYAIDRMNNPYATSAEAPAPKKTLADLFAEEDAQRAASAAGR